MKANDRNLSTLLDRVTFEVEFQWKVYLHNLINFLWSREFVHCFLFELQHLHNPRPLIFESM